MKLCYKVGKKNYENEKKVVNSLKQQSNLLRTKHKDFKMKSGKEI